MVYYQPVNVQSLTTLFQTAFFLSFTYAAWGRSIGLPISGYVRLEREVRQRLGKFSEISDEAILRDTKLLRRSSRRSESVLRFLVRAGSIAVYVSTVSAFVLMLLAAFNELYLAKEPVTLIMILLVLPIPLKMGSLWIASRYYLGEIERRIMDLARSTGVAEVVVEETHGATVKHKLEVALDHIEGALGRK